MPGGGPIGAPLGLLGEAPGVQEAASGLPFVGQAGRVLEDALAAVGVRRQDCYVGNRVRCRPPANRISEYPDALNECDTWTRAELALYNPRVMVLLGKTAFTPIFGDHPVWQVRGHMRHTGVEHPWGSRLWVATYHPAAVLRKMELFEMLVGDIRLAASAIGDLV